MTSHSTINLNSTEISGLWTTYLNDSMAACMLKHFLNNVEDEDVRTLLNEAYGICNTHIQTIGPILTQAEIALPMSFSDSDFNKNAPRLFTDSYYLYYLSNMSQFGMRNFSMALYQSARTDIRKFFSDSLIAVINFYGKLSDMMLSKGILIRSPIVSTTKSSDIINKKEFFTGIFSQPRSLLLMEIANIYANLLTCYTGRTLLQGFSQCAKDNEVRKYLFTEKKMLEHHIEVFSSIFKSEGVPVPSTSDMSVTDSVSPTFSDKLMVFHTGVLNVTNARNYMDAIASSMRNDINATFTRLAAEVGEYTSDGIDIMISNGWLEQPPQVVNHDSLVGV